MCSKEDYDRWKKGELLFNNWSDKLVEVSEEDLNDEDMYTYDKYWDDEYLEEFEQTFTTSSGEVVVAFGKYGMDG